MKNPMRTKDLREYGLAVREIYGFRIFGCNRVPISIEDNPMLIFFKEIARTLSCAAHVGPLAFGGLNALETFGPPTPDNLYMLNRIGLSGATFYSLDGEFYCRYDACFFPMVRAPFLGISAEDFDAIIRYDGLALMIGAMPQADKEMNTLYGTQFTDHAAWLTELTRIYDVVLLTGGDADFVMAYARHAEQFAVLDSFISVAQNAIMASEWYQQHETDLIWDGEYGMCYRLPAI